MNFLSSKVHNVFKIIYRHLCIKRYAWKSILDAHDLKALKQHCIKSMHDSVIKDTVWSQKHYQKSLRTQLTAAFTNSGKSSIMQIKSHMWIWSKNLRSKDNLKMDSGEWKTVLSSDIENLKFFLEIMDTTSSKLKRRRTIQLVISSQFKSPYFWWYGGCICAYGIINLHIWKAIISGEKYEF